MMALSVITEEGPTQQCCGFIMPELFTTLNFLFVFLHRETTRVLFWFTDALNYATIFYAQISIKSWGSVFTLIPL